MDHDVEHLRLLSIFHYIVGGLAVLFSFFPLFYSAIGGFLVAAARHPSAQAREGPPPEFIGWFFIFLGGLFFLLGLTIAILIVLSGRALHQRRRYWFAFIVACVECLFMPFGTALGVFTIIVLCRPSVKKLFGVEGA